MIFIVNENICIKKKLKENVVASVASKELDLLKAEKNIKGLKLDLEKVEKDLDAANDEYKELSESTNRARAVADKANLEAQNFSNKAILRKAEINKFFDDHSPDDIANKKADLLNQIQELREEREPLNKKLKYEKIGKDDILNDIKARTTQNRKRNISLMVYSDEEIQEELSKFNDACELLESKVGVN